MLASDQEDRKLYRTICILWGVEPVCMTLFVIQVNRCTIATRESRLARSNVIVHHERNEQPAYS